MMQTRRNLPPVSRVGAALLIAACIFLPASAFAQVVALVNGAPITELDVTQRIKLEQLTGGKTPSRKQALEDLINDNLKIFVSNRYGVGVSESEVDQTLAAMAARSHVTREQLEKSLSARGISPATLRFKVKADVGWNQLVRGRYSSSLQINDADIRHAMQAGDNPEKNDQFANVGYTYTMYPVTLIATSQAQAAGRIREAENLRGQFQSCAEGLRMARLLRGVVVRPPVIKSSADLDQQLRDTLDKMEIGKLTAPEVTPQGVQMFALCDRRASSDTPARRAVREQIFAKRFQAESNKFLAEVRRQAMIEYK